MAEKYGGGAESYARFKQYDYRAVSHVSHAVGGAACTHSSHTQGSSPSTSCCGGEESVLGHASCDQKQQWGEAQVAYYACHGVDCMHRWCVMHHQPCGHCQLLMQDR